ncbi:hypothetical protein SAMN05443572_10159 [Myxococcus fulvus]|uniref:Lipoprotein n=1 Tax=Myxococcus fulvus TaxID=33 RepID=A0A511T188_MYXFU|nr:hypothetical protein [Myxococcus fulvus]AKF84586.1 hypothetical protein MFUL124B02_01190 [Myxococcus fulvus 124B02]GEN07914.1 hypothetical protein MFU01_29510 [Myxococcus fulvus]SES75384.1 hypothetical protein SAMN05443572_10159 [Myxococcus fulvus]
MRRTISSIAIITGLLLAGCNHVNGIQVNGGNRTAAQRAKPFKLPDPNPSDEPVYGPAPSSSGSDAKADSSDAS